MQQANTPTWIADDWPNDFDIRAEVAEQQELLALSDGHHTAEVSAFPMHSFEYDFD